MYEWYSNHKFLVMWVTDKKVKLLFMQNINELLSIFMILIFKNNICIITKLQWNKIAQFSHFTAKSESDYHYISIKIKIHLCKNRVWNCL